MEEIGLILTKDGDTFNEQLLNFSGKYAIKKEKTRKRISEWREKQADTENVTRYKSVRNTDKVKESKVKESKERDSAAKIAATQARILHFKESLYPFTKNKGGIYPADMVKDFFNYWSELNPSGTKMKWEMQKTFEISKRLITWEKNEYKFNNNGKATEPTNHVY
jgi:hypothetical protein